MSKSNVGAGAAAAAPKLITTKECAHRIGKSESWLNKQRSMGRGPKYLRILGGIRYTEEFADEFLRGCVQETEDSRRSAAA